VSGRAAAPAIDPLTAWRSFKPNSLLYARIWLETGSLPDTCHFVIRACIEPWIAAVTAAGSEVRTQLLAEIPPIQISEPTPEHHWAMPSVGKPYSLDHDPAADAGPIELQQ
jgi:hypothetical protein